MVNAVVFFLVRRGLTGAPPRTLSKVPEVAATASDTALGFLLRVFPLATRFLGVSHGFTNFLQAQKFVPSSDALQPVLVH